MKLCKVIFTDGLVKFDCRKNYQYRDGK